MILISIISCNSLEAFGETKPIKIKSVKTLTEYALDDGRDIKLFGVTDDFFLEFNRTSYKKDLWNPFPNKDDRNREGMISSLNYENKLIIKEYKMAIELLGVVLSDTNINLSYMNNGEVLVSFQDVNLNEYLLKNGLVSVDKEDYEINDQLIKKFLLIENEAKQQNVGI